MPASTRSWARAAWSSGSTESTPIASAPSLAAAVRATAACRLAAAGKSSLPSSLMVTLRATRGQNGMPGLPLAVA